MQRNSQLTVDMTKAITKWKPIVEKLGVTDIARINELCEYAEMHSSAITSGMVNENVAYANPANSAGMGAVSFPTLSQVPGLPGGAGSGDLGQTLLPASLKIAANTPGLELVPTINVNSNRVDLLYFEWNYDDTNGFDNDERSSSFKFRPTDEADFTSLKTFLRAEMAATGTTELRGRLSKSLYFHLSGFTAPSGVVTAVAAYDSTVAPTASKEGWVQFKGFSRLDGMPMFRAYIQQNSASSGAWSFSPALNTFPAALSILAHLTASQIDETLTSATDFTAVPVDTVLLISAGEDFIDDFTTGGKPGTLTRGEWDTAEAGKLGPNSFTKSVEIGVAHVSAALRLSEIGDWKRMYGVDVVEKTKAQLINQISTKISVEIVEKIKEMGLKNRLQAPAAPAAMQTGLTVGGITDGRIYDMSVTATAGALGGEHNASMARKLWSKVVQASYFVATDGRIGGIDYVVTSGTLAGTLKGIQSYTINPFDAKMAIPGQLQPAGVIDGIKLYVDPFMSPADLTIYMGRVGTKEEPGIKFLAYMLAESVEITSEKTMAPRLYMYSRYAVSEFGFFPEKQYMAIKVEDASGILF
jgi:hypothetical protein